MNMNEHETQLYLRELESLKFANPEVARRSAEHVVELDRKVKCSPQCQIKMGGKRCRRIVPTNLVYLVEQARLAVCRELNLDPSRFLSDLRSHAYRNARQFALAVIRAIPMPAGLCIDRTRAARLIKTDANQPFSDWMKERAKVIGSDMVAELS
jgi:hypothetical protein